MAYTIESYPEDAIILVTIGANFDAPEEMSRIQADVNKAATRMGFPICRIIDLRHHELDFGKAVELLQLDTAADMGNATDKRFIPIYVGDDDMTKMIADSLQQEQYGGVEAIYFPDVAAALAYGHNASMKRKDA